MEIIPPVPPMGHNVYADGEPLSGAHHGPSSLPTKSAELLKRGKFLFIVTRAGSNAAVFSNRSKEPDT
jgi:hypothetical protein